MSVHAPLSVIEKRELDLFRYSHVYIGTYTIFYIFQNERY